MSKSDIKSNKVVQTINTGSVGTPSIEVCHVMENGSEYISLDQNTGTHVESVVFPVDALDDVINALTEARHYYGSRVVTDPGFEQLTLF